jgi:hypothetical protein
MFPPGDNFERDLMFKFLIIDKGRLRLKTIPSFSPEYFKDFCGIIFCYFVGFYFLNFITSLKATKF